MQKSLMELMDAVNAKHTKGVDFGTGHPLFPAEIHTLTAIEADEGITVTALAQCLNVSKPTVSERIRKLAINGLITKEKTQENAKAVTLWLTDTGRVACQGHEAHHAKMFERFTAHFGPAAPEKIALFHEAFTQFIPLAKSFESHKM